MMKWSNIPIPEAHAIGLIFGFALEKLTPLRLFQMTWVGYTTGALLILAGAGLCAWAVIEAREMDISSPNQLIKSGPYGFSRNPMYVGWTMIFLGVALSINSAWPVIILPIVLAYIHFIEIRKEEQELQKQFGSEYTQYRNRVRRYF